MPNWCEGSLKLRGKRDDILRFFQEGVNAYSYQVHDKEGQNELLDIPKEQWMPLEINPDVDVLYFTIPSSAWIYVEETKRAFLTANDYVDIYKPEDDPNGTCIAVCKVEQAWGFRIEEWEALSSKYNLDIRLFGIEQGMGFWEEIIITCGRTASHKLHRYDSYLGFVWECPFPWMGG